MNISPRAPFIVWHSEDRTLRVVAVPFPPTGNSRREGGSPNPRWEMRAETSKSKDLLGTLIYAEAHGTDVAKVLDGLAVEYLKVTGQIARVTP